MKKELKTKATSVRFTPTIKKMLLEIADEKGLSSSAAAIDFSIVEMYKQTFPKRKLPRLN